MSEKLPSQVLYDKLTPIAQSWVACNEIVKVKLLSDKALGFIKFHRDTLGWQLPQGDQADIIVYQQQKLSESQEGTQ